MQVYGGSTANNACMFEKMQRHLLAYHHYVPVSCFMYASTMRFKIEHEHCNPLHIITSWRRLRSYREREETHEREREGNREPGEGEGARANST